MCLSVFQGIFIAAIGGGYTQDGTQYYVDGYVTLDSNIPTTTTFALNISTAGGQVLVSVTVNAGSNIGSGTTLYGGSSPEPIGTACIVSCDNPSVILTGYTCP